jgi:hypothetical protein
MAVPFESVPHNFLPPLAPVLPLKHSREDRRPRQSLFRITGKPRLAAFAVQTALRITTTRRKSSEWSALEKPAALLPELLPAGAASNIRFRRLSSLANYARDFGCGLAPWTTLRVTPANRLNLELAKGFEPPTL